MDQARRGRGGFLRIAQVVAVALAACALPAQAQDPCHEKNTPECVAKLKAGCRMANDMGLDLARKLPVEGERDQRHKKELVARLEALITSNRASGVDECTTWGELNRIAARQ